MNESNRLMSWRVISYYTIGTGYEKEIKNLEADLLRFGIGYHVRGIKSLGSWRANTIYKAQFIRGMLDFIAPHSIVFIDADARIHEFPEQFSRLAAEGYDFACHFRNWRVKQNELMSGTLFFANNAKARAICDEWLRQNGRTPQYFEQFNLQTAIKRFEGRIKAFRLPVEYCAVFDSPERRQIKPIIEHFQKSRVYKREIGRP